MTTKTKKTGDTKHACWFCGGLTLSPHVDGGVQCADCQTTYVFGEALQKGTVAGPKPKVLQRQPVAEPKPTSKSRVRKKGQD